MNTWAISISLLVMALSAGVFVYAIRNFQPWRRTTLAGAAGSLQFGLSVLVSVTTDSSTAFRILQWVLLVGSIAFFGLEVYLWFKYPFPRQRAAE